MYLVIAPEGMLGTAFVKVLKGKGLPFRAAGLPDLDITDPTSVATGVGDDVRVVLCCAGWTDVDGAEEHEAEATRVNGEGTRILAERCEVIGAKLVQYSTDYVFRGDATDPYPVDALRDPLNAYGRSKAATEEALERSTVKHLLIRTSWLYAPWANNFVRTMIKLGATKPELKVVHDQRGRPTSAEHLATSTLGLLEAGSEGVFHVTDGGECTWWELAKHVIAQVSETCVVHPCSTAEFPRPAPRPRYSVLDLSRTEAVLGPMPDWRVHVDTVVAATPTH